MEGQGNHNPRPLLPAVNRLRPSPSEPTCKRPRASVACETCRIKRTKCTAERPTCARCKSRNLECQYAVDSDDENRRKALKKRFDWADSERNQLRDLFNILTSRSESEAAEIYRRLRSTGDPLRVLQSVKQAYLLLPSPGPVSQFSAHPQVERLDSEAYRSSPLKLRARPWTAVADDGIVSSLISSFFVWDGLYFLPLVDQECFIRDMSTGNIKRAKFCSPFLVNAICTIQSFYSDKVKMIRTTTGRDLCELFDAEARRHLQLSMEVASLPTAQGSIIMYMNSAYFGRDRAGAMYRHLGYDMLDRLEIPKSFETMPDLLTKRAHSTAVWGAYCYESIIAALQNKTPALRVPTIPRVFREHDHSAKPVRNVDLSGELFTSASFRPPLTPGIFSAACDLNILQDEIIKYNEEMLQSGKEDDLSIRKELYNKVLAWRKALPHHLRNEVNHTPGTSLLRVHYEEVAIFALRFLHPKTNLIDHMTAKELRYVHCQHIVNTVEHHFRTHLPGDYSAFFLNALYHVCIALIPSLEDPISQQIFTRAAIGLRREPVDLPGLVFVIRGLEALARGMKKNIPPVAKASFFAMKEPSNTGDVLIEYGFPPQLEYVQGDSGDGSKDTGDTRGRLGALIHRWNALTLCRNQCAPECTSGRR